MKKSNITNYILGLGIIFFLCSSCSQSTIDYSGVKIRIKSFELRKNYLAIRLDYNTGGQDITLKSADFILIDKQEKKYLCVGFAGMSFVLSEGESSYVETDAVHSEISVMSEEWGSFPLIILFDGVNSNIGTLKLRYRGSKNFIRIRL